MEVPKESPKHLMLVQVPGGTNLVLVQRKFGFNMRTTVFLQPHDLIWLYQACMKYLREQVLPDGFREMEYDLVAAIQAVTGINVREEYPVALAEPEVEKISDLMVQKGWVKQ